MALIYDELIVTSRNATEDSRQFSNRVSSLSGRSGFLPHVGLTVDSPIGQEFFHQPSIDSWLADKPPSTARAALAHHRWWRAQYAKVLAAQQLPTDPHERLKTAISRGLKNSGLTKKALANEIGVPPQTLRSWARGQKMPSRAAFLARLEAVLDLPPGTLATCQSSESRGESFFPQALMPVTFQGRSERAQRLRSQLRWSLPADFPSLGAETKRHLIAERAATILNNPVREHRSRARKHPYGIKLDEAPERLQRELASFLAYKTNPVEIGYRRPKRGQIRRQESWNNWRTLFSLFFGWYLLPPAASRSAGSADLMLHGAGGSAEELTLGLFAVPELLSDYLHWISYVRSKAPTHTTVGVLQKVKSLLHPDAGWLIQNPKLIARVPERWLTEHHSAHLKFLEAEAARANPLFAELERARARIKKGQDD